MLNGRAKPFFDKLVLVGLHLALITAQATILGIVDSQYRRGKSYGDQTAAASPTSDWLLLIAGQSLVEILWHYSS